MAEKTITFTCWHCKQETTVIVTVAKPLATQSRSIPAPYYCAHCQRANKVPLPDNIGVHAFVLGKDRGFLGYTPSGIPRLQGEP